MASAVAVVLAAGKSTRMKSELPKVLHPVCGRLMIDYVLDAAREAGVQKIVVIVGHKSEEVKTALNGHGDVVFAEQIEQNGTGHAVMMAEPELRGHEGSVLILAGDTPLLQGASLASLLSACETDDLLRGINICEAVYLSRQASIYRDTHTEPQCAFLL